MLDLLRSLMGPRLRASDTGGVTGSTPAALTDLKSRVANMTAPAPAGVAPTVPPADAVKAIEADEVQLTAATQQLPAAAGTMVADIKKAVEVLSTMAGHGDEIKADCPSLLLFQTRVRELEALLAGTGRPAGGPPAADTLEQQKAARAAADGWAKGQVDGLLKAVKNDKPADVMAAFKAANGDPAKCQALFDALKSQGCDFNKLFKNMGDLRQPFVTLTAPLMNNAQRADAVKGLERGLFSPDAQEQRGILTLLQAAGHDARDTQELVGNLNRQGLSYSNLYGDMNQSNRAQFLQATAPGMSTVQKAQAFQQLDHGVFSPSAAEQKAMTCLLTSEQELGPQQQLLKTLEGKGFSYERIANELDSPVGRAQFTSNYLLPGDYDKLNAKLQAKGLPATSQGLEQTLLDDLPQGERGDVLSQLQQVRARVGGDEAQMTHLLAQLLALRDEWTKMARGPKDKDGNAPPFVDPKELFKQTLTDLADPPQINQAQWGTCDVTRAQMALALQNPGRYVELMRLLASEQGDASAVIPGLRRPADQDLSKPDNMPVDDKKDTGRKQLVGEGSRPSTVRIMSPAFQSYVDGGFYNNTKDKHEKPFYRADLWDYRPRMNDLLANTLGTKFETVSTEFPCLNSRSTVLSRLDEAAKRGPVPVDLNWGSDKYLLGLIPGAHSLLFVGTEMVPKDPDHPDGPKEKVAMLLNPWGQKHTMPYDEFQQRIISVFVPDPSQPPIPRPKHWENGYVPLENNQYMNPRDTATHAPGYQTLSGELRGRLLDFIGDNKLDAAFVGSLQPMLDKGLIDEAALRRLDAVAKRNKGSDQIACVYQQVQNALALDKEPAFKALPAATRNQLLDILASKDVVNDPFIAEHVELLAQTGKLTPAFLKDLAARPSVTTALTDAAAQQQGLTVVESYDAFKQLADQTRWQTMTLLASKDVHMTDDLRDDILSLATANKLTPALLKLLAAQPDADRLVAALHQQVTGADRYGYELSKPQAEPKLAEALRGQVVALFARNNIAYSSDTMKDLATLDSHGALTSELLARQDGPAVAAGLQHAARQALVQESQQKLQANDGFNMLQPEVRRQLLAVLANRELLCSDELVTDIGRLALAGKVTPQLLKNLEGMDKAEAVAEALHNQVTDADRFTYDIKGPTHPSRGGLVLQSTFDDLQPAIRQQLLGELIRGRGGQPVPYSRETIQSLETLIHNHQIDEDFLKQLHTIADGAEVARTIKDAETKLLERAKNMFNMGIFP